MTTSGVIKGIKISSKSRGIQYIFVAATFLLLFLCVVIPNSAQTTTAVVMIACFFLSLSITRLNHHLVRLVFLYLCGVAVTLFYLIVGLHHDAPLMAVQQIIIIYILSPLMWIFITAGLTQMLGVERLIRWFVLFAFLGCLSIALFFYLFIHFGPEAVSFFKENANLDLANGYAASTMFVYGSLLFICGGFFSTPELIGNRAWQALLLIALASAALTSGRSALILSIPLGIVLGWIIPTKTNIPRLSSSKINRKVPVAIWIAAFGAVLILSFTHVDVLYILKSFFDELLSGGGSARSEQIAALLDASIDTNGAGSGHGVGVSYSRSDEYPWRYESVWVATIFRVGVIGSLIYLLPFLWYSMKTLRLAKSNELLPSQKFMFSGFVCAFLAANTNPYIESFAFQWMYVLPIVSLFTITTGAKNSP